MKDKKELKIVFMGTPEFAVAQLDELLDKGYNVVAVVTVPDKPAGRGKRLSQSAVKVYAEQKNLKILQPEKLKDEHFLSQLRDLNADMFVVVAFRMLPEVVWEMPAMGTFNIHGSLLPDYRGAAPINWAIIDGCTRTGLSSFMLDKQIDTGSIILSKDIDILPSDDFGSMYGKMMELGRELTIETVETIRKENFSLNPQPEVSQHPHAPKIFKEHTLIYWTKTAKEVVNLIRGLSPIPCAYTLLWATDKDISVKIYKARATSRPSNGVYGEILIENKKLFVSALDYFVEIEELKVEGKKQMRACEFLNGFRHTGEEKFL